MSGTSLPPGPGWHELADGEQPLPHVRVMVEASTGKRFAWIGDGGPPPVGQPTLEEFSGAPGPEHDQRALLSEDMRAGSSDQTADPGSASPEKSGTGSQRGNGATDAAGADDSHQAEAAGEAEGATESSADETGEAPKLEPPLDTLFERAKTDASAPFDAETLIALSELRASDRRAYEWLRIRLRKAGVRITALEKAIAGEVGESGERQTQAALLVEIASAAELFHSSDLTPYADITVEGHRETWQVRSRGFKRWLSKRYYEDQQGAPSSDALQSALGVIEAKAHYDAPELTVFLRIGEHEEKLYLDLVDATWRAVEIDPAGWRLVTVPPCRFRRTPGMLPLPEPVRGGSIDQLRAFLNVKQHDKAKPHLPNGEDDEEPDAGFVLAVAVLLASFRPVGPYPALIVTGEHGSAKSTLLNFIRSLIDPGTTPLRALPRNDRDLFIAAGNSHWVAYDNVSRLPEWLSDSLCRLTSGGGHATRALWTDDEEKIFEATRPIGLNGIVDFVHRPDLADRAIFLTLQAIGDEARRRDDELKAEFAAAQPAMLGSLLDAVAHGLRALPDTKLTTLPRMADFAIWASACEGALGWTPGTFMAAYAENRRTAIADVVERDPVGSALCGFLDKQMLGRWEGTLGALLEALREQAGDTVTKATTWPATPEVLSSRLRRLASFLRALGIECTIVRKRHGGPRTVTLIVVRPQDNGSSAGAEATDLFLNEVLL